MAGGGNLSTPAQSALLRCFRPAGRGVLGELPRTRPDRKRWSPVRSRSRRDGQMLSRGLSPPVFDQLTFVVAPAIEAMVKRARCDRQAPTNLGQLQPQSSLIGQDGRSDGDVVLSCHGHRVRTGSTAVKVTGYNLIHNRICNTLASVKRLSPNTWTRRGSPRVMQFKVRNRGRSATICARLWGC